MNQNGVCCWCRPYLGVLIPEGLLLVRLSPVALWSIYQCDYQLSENSE